MKKILLITRPLTPPWDEASKNFAYSLAKSIKNHKFHVLTNGFSSDFPENIVQHPIYSSNDLSLAQKIRLFRAVKIKKEIQIIHFMFTPTKLNSFIFKIFFSSRSIKSIQTIATLREDIYSPQEIKKMMFADIVVTYSDYAREKLIKYGLKSIERIYPGIDTEKYSPQQKDKEVLDFFNLKKEDLIITYPGEYSRLGATDDIIDSLPSIFDSIPHAKFVFACRVKNDKDMMKKNEIITKLKDNNILEKVVFTDTYSEMNKLYNLSDIVVFPVKNMKGKFDVPLAVIEAMSCAKPVIISNIPVLREFASESNSVIIDIERGFPLKEKIKLLAEDSDLRKSIGENARKYVIDNFNIKNTSNLYKDIYERL